MNAIQKAIFLVALVAVSGGLWTVNAFAEDKAKPSLTVTDSSSTGLYKTGQEITFTITATNVDAAADGSGLSHRVLSNGEEIPPARQSGTNPLTLTVPAKEPGFVWCEASLAEPKMATTHFVGVDPEKLRPQISLPEDFQQYWKQQVDRLKAVPMNPVEKEVPVTDWLKNQARVYDIRVDCVEGTPVTAYLSMPMDASAEKRYPIRVSFHGHTYFPSSGSHPKPNYAAVERAIFLDVNPFGVVNGETPEYYKNTIWKELRNEQGSYPYRNWDDRDKVYFHGMFLRAVRALEYAKTRPEWDGRNLIVEGSSMGGAQALVAAALDPQVSACIANVPAMGEMMGSTPGWPYLINAWKNEPQARPPALEENAPYYDSVNFARFVKAPTLVGVGLNDSVCPPPSVWAIYNSLQSPKQIIVSPQGIHNWNQEMKDAMREWIREQIKTNAS